LALVVSLSIVYVFMIIIYTISVYDTLMGGVVVKLDTIGKNIRKYRLLKKLRQEDLAEKAGLSINYVGAIERGEKVPSLETLLAIINALGVSADMILVDVIDTGYIVKDSLLAEKLDKLSAEDRAKIYDVIDTMLKHSTQVKP
jgi:transcriptional regulator with XRE-family HTH domain